METEPRVKATHKTKKKTFGGFYANYARWDVRGKSSKELKLYIEDLRNCITHQLVRIKKIKYVLELYKAKDVTDKLIKTKEKVQKQIHAKELMRDKVYRREDRIEKLDSEVEQLELESKAKDREIAKLNRELDKSHDILQEVRSQKKRGYTRTVKEKLSREAQRLQKIADGGVDEKTLNNLEYLTRTHKFLKKKGLTFDQFTTVMQAEVLGSIKKSDLLTTSYSILTQLTEKGYLQSNNAVGAKKYWFVSMEGKQLIKDHKNALSFGKSILTQ
jgi:hypothetical protein